MPLLIFRIPPIKKSKQPSLHFQTMLQAKMRLYVEKWEEHDERVQELLDQRKALQQAEDLARQQAKILEMAKMQEEYIKKQQELDAAQAKVNGFLFAIVIYKKRKKN